MNNTGQIPNCMCTLRSGWVWKGSVFQGQAQTLFTFAESYNQ